MAKGGSLSISLANSILTDSQCRMVFLKIASALIKAIGFTGWDQ